MGIKKTLNLFFLTITLTIANSYATSEQDYRNLCSYDQKWCGRLKNSDGTWVRPKKEIVQLLKQLGPTIEKHAATLGVDPRAVAGSIMAENSLNVSISDDVQDLLVKIGVANKGEVLGKKFTYGLGQLNFQAAREGENYAAKLEGRPPVSDKVLSDSLLIPEKAIYYVAAVLRKCQDDYKKQGIDIANKPEILTTLYNLGHSGTKAVELKKSGANPRPNYFGFFVKRYQNELNFLNRTPAKLAEKAPEKKPAIIIVNLKPSKKEKTLIALKPVKETVETRQLKLAFTKNMPLYSAPPVCDIENNYGGTDLKNKYNSMKAFSVSAIAEKEKSFQVIAPSIDCEANTWELIKLNSGEMGWIKHDDLEKTTSKILIAETKCTPKVDLKCSAELQNKIKDNILSFDKSKGEIFLSPLSGGKKASFKKADWECRVQAENDNLAAPNTGGISTATNTPFGFTVTNYSGGGGYGSGGPSSGVPITKKIGAPKNSDDALKEVVTRIEKKQNDIEEYYKAPLNDPRNPYSGIPFQSLKDGVGKCINKQLYKLDSCQLDLAQVDKLLGAMELKPKISKDDRSFLTYNMQLIPSGLPFITKSDFVSAMKNNPYGMSFGMMGGFGIGGYGYPGMGALDSQYAFREGDEKIWRMEDIEQALKECNLSLLELGDKINNDKNLDYSEQQGMLMYLQQIRMSLGVGPITSFDVLKSKTSEEKEKLWPQVQGEFVQSSKLCLSLKDTFDLAPKTNSNDQQALRNYNCFYQNLSVLENGSTLMLKDIVKESMYSPSGLGMLGAQFSLSFNQYSMYALGLSANGTNGANGVPGGNVMPVVTPVEVPPSYCPNRTAEMIEELVKDNPCIGKVYVPDKWLLNRLNELGDKVVFKPFAEDDRFSIDVEKTQCK